MPERRASPRVPASVGVRCRWRDGEEHGRTVNISAGGVLLIVPKKIPAGTCVTLELDPEAEALELRGLVRHATEDPGIRGHGIEFVEVLPSQRDALLDYLARLQAPQSSAASA